MASHEFDSIDDFLKHRSREGSKFLRGWKEKGWIEVWLHTKQLPIALWQHRFPRMQVSEKDGASTVTFFGQSLNCLEDENVLKQQNKYNPDGSRAVPPTKCPVCKLLVTLENMVLDGKLGWTDPVFRFEGATDPKHNIVLHAGGIYGSFGGKLNEAEQAKLRAAGISQQEDGWKESAVAKLNYAFVVVDDAAPQEGVQVMIETGLLGDKVKDVINGRIAALVRMHGKDGAEKMGNPLKTPYIFKLTHNKTRGIPFNQKYGALYIEAPLRPEIEELIKGPKPDLTQVLAPLNPAVLRGVMEKYAVVDLPWDEIFGKDVVASDGQQPAEAAQADADIEFPPKEAPKPAPAGGRRVAAPPPAPTVATLPCEKCGHPMLETEDLCKKCGQRYVLS